MSIIIQHRAYRTNFGDGGPATQPQNISLLLSDSSQHLTILSEVRYGLVSHWEHNIVTVNQEHEDYDDDGIDDHFLLGVAPAPGQFANPAPAPGGIMSHKYCLCNCSIICDAADWLPLLLELEFELEFVVEVDPAPVPPAPPMVAIMAKAW